MRNLLERQKLAHQNMFYSVQRIDLLIISICGAGIYVCFETIKFLSTKDLPPNIWVKFAGGFFLFGIIVNFLSQLTSFKSNQQDYLMCLVETESEEALTDAEKKLRDNYDNSADKYSWWTEFLNYTSMGFMFVGLILLGVYFIFIF